jgi:hypothetical protein
MPRDFAALSGGPAGILVPRWMLATGIFLFASLLAFVAFSPPSWTIQRLESPDGSRTAVLSRTQFSKPCFVIKVKDGIAWRTLLVSPPITNSFREDLGERLLWSSNSTTLFFRMQDRFVWKHDF